MNSAPRIKITESPRGAPVGRKDHIKIETIYNKIRNIIGTGKVTIDLPTRTC